MESAGNWYNQDGVIVRQSVVQDVNMNLRQSDIDEVWASHHLRPREALELSFRKSMLCQTIEDNGTPIAMFGINAESLIGNWAVIWMLASPLLAKRQYRFVRRSREFVRSMLETFPYLYNFVDSRNRASIQWLKFCGARILEEQPFGLEGKPFHYFFFERTLACVPH